jgi:O-acetyl-ADP-ribose deacetylase (regulator of RNase III)
MLYYSNKTVFNVGSQVIVNTVNCVGVMGNGLALECRLRYPAMFEDYVTRCKMGRVRVGKPYLYWETPTFGILNFPVKIHWKYPARLSWVEQSLQGFRRLYETTPISSVAFPLVGCHLGKLNPDEIGPLMECFLADLPCEVYICLDREEYATGIEGRMVALVNNDSAWRQAIGLRREIVEAILKARPVKRFRDIRQIAGIGKTTYERLHRWLYSKVSGELTLPMNPPECAACSDRQLPLLHI